MLRTLGYAILLVMASSLSALAQSPGDPPTKSQDELLKPEELDALVAPIAIHRRVFRWRRKDPQSGT